MAWQVITYNWQWPLKSSAEALWPYVADTLRFNQATGLPAIEFSEIPAATGGSRVFGRVSKFGLTVEYEDHPFEWIQNQEFSNTRTFSHGPIARTYARLTLTPTASGTLLGYHVQVTPANLVGLLGTPYQFGWDMRRNASRVFRRIDDYLQGEVYRPFTLKVSTLTRSGWVRLTNLTEQLTSAGYEARWVQRLADALIEEADLNLVRMRPYELADTWRAPRRVILEMCLSAAKLGLLNMRWDVICPMCRGAKESVPALDGLHQQVHCPTCNVDFRANFSHNVELTFTPHPQIRAVQTGTYCIGGPMMTPHILAHQVLGPGETRTLDTRLSPGHYRLRTQRPGVEQWLDINAADRYEFGRLSIQLGNEQIEAAAEPAVSTTNGKGLTLVLVNQADYMQRFYLEQAEWYTNAATAAEVTALQHFRDLFSDEVLRPGEEIGVQGVAVLFTDLVGSTAMYNRVGDAPSYALVREQFDFLQQIVRDHEGGIVKTIGDAIMAVFVDSAKAVKAALTIQRQIDTFNAGHPNRPLIIRLGLHHGPCIAVNLNGRLDYFGATVNLAARLEGQSKGRDVVIADKLRHDPAVAELLAGLPINIEQFETTVKGFDEHLVLYRLTWAA